MVLIGDAKQANKSGPVETGLTELVATPCNAITTLYREKTFVNFVVLWLFAKVFSAKFGGVACFGAAKMSNLRTFSP